MLNEVTISKGIIASYVEKFTDALELDVAIVGDQNYPSVAEFGAAG